jgi:hypothetical protein
MTRVVAEGFPIHCTPKSYPTALKTDKERQRKKN